MMTGTMSCSVHRCTEAYRMHLYLENRSLFYIGIVVRLGEKNFGSDLAKLAWTLSVEVQDVRLGWLSHYCVVGMLFGLIWTAPDAYCTYLGRNIFGSDQAIAVDRQDTTVLFFVCSLFPPSNWSTIDVSNVDWSQKLDVKIFLWGPPVSQLYSDLQVPRH